MQKNISILITFLLFFCATTVFAQNIQVTGVVSDESGEALIGASVLVKGTTNGAITDINGKFTIQQVSSQATLVVSYVGYLTQEVAVNGQRTINIRLREDTQRLDEVVVVGYSTQQKRDITGSVAVINTKELLKSTGSSALAQVQGKVSGVYIGTSNAAGGETTVRIRGVNSVNNNSPLYVIDGISSRDANLNSINPNDIESMQVLKDASAQAIYGAQAANGVILITTKKGINTGQPILTYDMYYGWQVPGRKYDVLNSKDRMDLEYLGMANAMKNSGAWDRGDRPSHELFKNTGNGFEPYKYQSSAGGGMDSWSGLISGSPTGNPADYYYGYPGMQMITEFSDTDWFDEITQNAPVQNHQFGVRGGTDRGQYSASVNIFDQKSLNLYAFYRRYSTRLNTSFKVRPWLRIGEDFSYSWNRNLGISNENTEGTMYSQSYRATPWVPVYDLGGHYSGSVIPGTGNWNNPVAQLTRNKDNYYNGSRLNLSAWAELDLYKGLMFTSRYGIEYSQSYYYRMSKYNLEFNESPRNNNLEERSRFTIRTVWSNTLQYSNTFNDIHRLTALVGTEAISDGVGRQLTGQRYGYQFEDNVNTWVLNMGERSDMREANSEYIGEYALFGIFGRLDYALKDRYLMTATVRRDGVSRFATKNRYGTFPAVTLGWRVSEESFMSSTRNWLDDLKLRAGYGQVGNAEGPSPTNFASQFAMSSTTANYPVDGSNTGATAYRQSRIGNEDTKWEAIESINVGLDASFLKGKFGLSFEWYKKTTTNMLIQAAYSALAGEATAPYVNYGDMSNTGYDAMITYYDGKGDWKWNASLTFSHYKNKVGRLTEQKTYELWAGGDRINNGGQINRTTMGQPMAMFYGYVVDGFYENAQQVKDRWPIGVTSMPTDEQAQKYVGFYKFAKYDPRPEYAHRLTTADRTNIGNPHPDLIGGLNLGLSYKNVDLTMFWYASIGNDIFNNTNAFTDFQLFRGNRSIRMRDWSWEPGKTDAKLPMVNRDDNYSFQVCSYFIEDGSFLRMNNLVLGYTFPKSLLQKATISNLRVYGQLENALTFTKYTGLNPDVGNRYNNNDNSRDLNRGVDGGGWPNVIRFVFGLNFAF